MTIKTESLLQSKVNINSRGDTRGLTTMQKRGAVRNLFGSPDRSELQRQCQQQHDEQNKNIRALQIVGVIGLVPNPPDHAKRQKRSSSVQSESEDDVAITPPPISPQPTHKNASQNLDGVRNVESSLSVVVASSSSTSQQSQSTSSTSSLAEDRRLSNNMNGSPRNVALPRVQRTITSYFPVVKGAQNGQQNHHCK